MAEVRQLTKERIKRSEAQPPTSNGAKAFLKNYRQSPRKVRLVADAIRGKRIPEALLLLSHMDKRAAHPMEKLIRSAVANAKVRGIPEAELRVARIAVDKGFVFTKYMPRARGRATPIKKRTSRISLELRSSGNEELGSRNKAKIK
jgi:large subunit ribosomal protein L22